MSRPFGCFIAYYYCEDSIDIVYTYNSPINKKVLRCVIYPNTFLLLVF